jgi:hypothetical protein
VNANPKEPAVGLAWSLLSDEMVRGLIKQAGLSFPSNKNETAEFRSRLQMSQPSPNLMQLEYEDPDEKLSAAAANSVANMLVAWVPSPVPATATTAPTPHSTPSAAPASAQPHRALNPSDSPSPALLKLEELLAATDEQIAALKTAPPQASGSRKSDAGASDASQLSAERTRLTQAIAVERRREAVQLDQAKLAAGNSPTPVQASPPSSPPQAPVHQPVDQSASQILQRPFTLIRLAVGDNGARPIESGTLWQGALAAILGGLLYLGGAVWRYRDVGNAVPLEQSALNSKLTLQDATNYADSHVHNEDFWAKEVEEALARTSFGLEEDVLAVNSRRRIDTSSPELQGQAQYDEVLPAFRDQMKRNPTNWITHTEEARIALATGEPAAAIKEVKPAAIVDPEEWKAQLSKIVAELDRNTDINK